MKIEKLEVENFRGWLGSHEIEFSTDPSKPVTLIIAENGTGKSNILEAIMWCLHGELPENTKERERIINAHELKKNKNAKTSVKLTLVDDRASVFTGDTNPRYYISKEMRNGQTPSTSIYELDEGRQRPREYKRKEQLIEKLLPQRLSKFFLFSGEGIEQLFSDIEETKLKQAIEDIQGLTFARKALLNIELYGAFLSTEIAKTNRANEKTKKAAALIERTTSLKQKELKTKDKLISEKGTKEARIKIIEDLIKNSNHEIAKITQEQLSEHEATRGRSIANKEVNEKELRKLMGDAPSIFLYEARNSLKKFLWKNELKGVIPAPADEIFVKNLLDKGICICERCFEEGSAEERAIKSLLDISGNEEQNKNRTSIAGFINSFMVKNENFKKSYESREIAINNEEGLIADLNAKIEGLKQTLTDLNDDEIDSLIQEKDSLDKRLMEIIVSLANIDSKIKGFDKEIADAKKDITSTGSGDDDINSKKLSFVENCHKKLSIEIDETQKNGRDKLIEKLNLLAKEYDTKRQKFRYANDESYTPYMFDESLGARLPENQGNAVLKSIFYATSLIDICKERFNSEDMIIQPGTIAPMVCDAVFSALSKENASTVTRLLSKIPDQTILMINSISYEGACEEVLDELDVIGKSYLFQRKQPEINKDISKIKIKNKTYDAFIKDKNLTSNNCISLKI